MVHHISSDMDQSKIVKLKSCDNSFQAHLLKGKLENEGIPCSLSNENMNTLYGGINNTFTAVGVYVFEKDYDKAVEIMNDVNDTKDIAE